MRSRRQRIYTVGTLMMASLLAATVGFSAYVTTALYQKSGDIDTVGGEVSLRSYFQKGSGTSEDPFVISRPIHFYNLCRLQNLGVFSQSRYFVLGFDPDHPNDTRGENPETDLTFYKDNTGNELVNDHTLDMNPVYEDFGLSSIASIGNEGSPFYGNFDGQGLAIKNLKMSSTPEDVGVFGYTYPGSSVHDLYLIDPKITDDGYETNAIISPMYSDPESIDVSNLVTWNEGQTIHENGSEPITATAPGRNAIVSFANVNPKVNVTARIPSLASQFPGVTYQWRSSSPLLSIPEDNAGVIENLPFNSYLLDESDDRFIEDYAPFVNSESGATFHIRLTLVASATTEDGLHYSKVLSTYLVVIHHNVDSLGTSSYSYQVIKDKVEDDTNGLTQYAHGANIGLLCGHAEGGFINCFVYGGRISLNNQRAGIAPIAQESEMGLVGELGTSSNASILPIQDFQKDNDTGVLNFSKIYEDIAGGTHTAISGTSYYRYTPGEHKEKFVGDGSTLEFTLNYVPQNINYVTINGVETTAYTPYGALLTFDTAPAVGKEIEVYYSSDSSEKFDEYLLNNQLGGNNKFYATDNDNTVDFIGKKVVEDTATDKRRGLGVFSLNTSPVDSNTNDTYFNRMGEFVIARDNSVNQSQTFNDFYYTTAEFNADMDGDGVPTYEDVYGWHGSYKTRVDNNHTNLAEYHINQPYKFPDNVSPTTWNPYFERYFNYNIHCSLTEDSTTSNYFYNTNSDFLSSYFKYKLIDSTGTAPSPGEPTFGVFVRNVNPETGNEKPITSFDSVLAVTEDENNRFDSFNSQSTEIFTGNGSVREFDLKRIPIGNPTVSINGQSTTAFTYRNGRITFNSSPENNSEIRVSYTQQNPAQTVVFSIKNDVGANITIFASSTSTTGDYVGIYKANRTDLFSTSANSNVTSKPDYAMYLPYYTGPDTANDPCFHYYDYDYESGNTSRSATDVKVAQNRLYAHTFYLPKGEYIVSSPEGTAQLVYLCAQGQNGRGNTGLGKPTGVNSIQDIDFIAKSDDPKTYTRNTSGHVLDTGLINIRCYFAFYSSWDNSATSVPGANDLVISTSLLDTRPQVDITSGSNLTYFLADNSNLNACSFNGSRFNKQFYEYRRP